ncbi:MAG: ribulose-phosphate 3-epimerase [Planctomycetes bacterium GWF2_41_51]|nr:MAG: ribulose-phosphate 3-epimerase [Planctomycetes bacterium GWF2_41_51]HBG25495.1 ribulose-phosphate 3-epimerase [Phycisphaerales bacterium]
MKIQKLPKAGSIEIAPSILSANFACLGNEIAQVEKAGVKIVHLDVMDGHFVPNITIGPVVISKIRKCSNLFFDSHLMISEPEKYADAFIKAGVNNITFHIEVVPNPKDFINKLHDSGVSASICLNPETPVSAIEKYAHLADMILVMTVHPGFGGQSFIQEAADKIKPIRQIIGPDIRIEVDGGIDPETTPIVTGLGADTLVAGNAIFGQPDRAKAIEAIRNSVKV